MIVEQQKRRDTMNRLQKLLKRQKHTEQGKGSVKWSSSEPSTGYQDTGSPETKASPDSPSSTVFSSLKEITLENWILCACNHDYTPLIRSGNPSPEELEEAWSVLVGEFEDLTASPEATKMGELTSKIEALNSKIIFVTCIVEALREQLHEELVQELKEWGYEFKYTEQSIANDLNRVMVKLANDKTRLAMAVKEYEGLQEERTKNGDSAGPSEKSYMQLLLQIEDLKKRDFDPSTLNMYKFGLMCNDLVRHNKLLKSKRA